MAGEREKDKGTAKPGAEVPRKLDRRDVLAGLSTVPALGLFGYAWSKQREYQQATIQAAAAPKAAVAGLKEINVALLGAGAQGQVLTDSMLRIPGLRFRAVCDIWAEYNQKRVVNSLEKFKHEVNVPTRTTARCSTRRRSSTRSSSPRPTSGTRGTRSTA